MSKTCPACGGSISVFAHLGQSEGADFHCPSCHAQLAQALSTLGKLLAAGSFGALAAAVVMQGPDVVDRSGPGNGLLRLALWGRGLLKSAGTLRDETLREAFSRPMIFAGSFVGLLGIRFVLLALRLVWVIVAGITAPTQKLILWGVLAPSWQSRVSRALAGCCEGVRNRRPTIAKRAGALACTTSSRQSCARAPNRAATRSTASQCARSMFVVCRRNSLH